VLVQAGSAQLQSQEGQLSAFNLTPAAEQTRFGQLVLYGGHVGLGTHLHISHPVAVSTYFSRVAPLSQAVMVQGLQVGVLTLHTSLPVESKNLAVHPLQLITHFAPKF